MSASVNESYTTSLGRRQFLNTQKTVYFGAYTALLPRLSNRSNCRRFTFLDATPGNRPLPLQRMSDGLADKQYPVILQNNGSNIEDCFWHRTMH